MAADVSLVIISFHIICLFFSPIADGHSLLNSTLKFRVLAIGKNVLVL